MKVIISGMRKTALMTFRAVGIVFDDDATIGESCNTIQVGAAFFLEEIC